jgi:1,2-phenylacetyl-CoA epoxidase catalytic subunit
MPTNNGIDDAISNATNFIKNTLDEFTEDPEYAVSVVRMFVSMLLIAWVMSRVCDCCSDPFGENMRKRLRECEFDLRESENTISALEEELKEKTEELDNLRAVFQNYRDRYVSCKHAAQRFIDTHPDPDPIS